MKKLYNGFLFILLFNYSNAQWNATVNSPALINASSNGNLTYSVLQQKFNLPTTDGLGGKIAFIGSDGNYSNGVGFISGGNVASPIVWMYNYDDRNAFTVAVKNYSTGESTLGDNLNPLFQVRANGNVGIGTTDPKYKLAVYGVIGATKVKVTQNNWPDYVFEKQYPLLPLSEVESFIRINKHLPGVPSAREVISSDLDLGDTQAILLKKIEELTLYLIELKNENESLHQRMIKLERNQK